MTSHLRFLWARLTGDEAALESLSLTPATLMQGLSGRSVALIGNAKSLGTTRFGPQIDAADLVIRLNAAPMPDAASHGTRTDWIALSTPIPDDILRDRNPDCVLWMTRKRKRLPYGLATRPGFYLNRLSDVARLRAVIGGPPTTGLMMIDLLSALPPPGSTCSGLTSLPRCRCRAAVPLPRFRMTSPPNAALSKPCWPATRAFTCIDSFAGLCMQ